MIKNVIVNGQVYSGVDKVKLKDNDNKDNYCVFVETSDATATAEDVAAGKITYSNGEKIVGTKVDNGGGDTPVTLQSKTVDPKTTQQTVVADSSYTGLSGVTVNAVTNSIDSNIQASNIKKGVSILGVTGTLEQGGSGETVVTNFPFPHNNIQVGSFTPTENELSHTITCNFEPKGFLCIIDDPDEDAGAYAGVAWFYLCNAKGNGLTQCWYRNNSGKELTAGTSGVITITDNTLTLSAEVIKNYYFYAGRTYNWVAWDF